MPTDRQLSDIMTDLPSISIGNAELLAKDKDTGAISKVDGKISNISQTATEADLKEGNYLVLDGVDGTKRLPAEVVQNRLTAKTIKKQFSVVDNLLNTLLVFGDDGFDAAKVSKSFSAKILKALNEVLPICKVDESGFFVVDNRLNVGFSIDSRGFHAVNSVEFYEKENA